MGIEVRRTLSAVRRAHRTNKYKTNALVVRRGLSVRVATSSTKLSASLVPIRSSRTLDEQYSVILSTTTSTGNEKDWTLSPSSVNGQLDLFIPVSAKVGLYVLSDEEDPESSAVPLVVLFNPYVSDDSVYMSSKNDLKEYLLNESGRIWRGSHDSFSGMPWVYAQFHTRVLLSALDLLDRMPVSDRSNPVQVSRALSALLNSSDRDNGVIVGNWSGDYEDGVSPTAWTGSLDILTRYWDNNSRPVRYGQCWVFAGVFTSVLRTLGIPSQVVTNFASAHENKPYNRILENYYTKDGEPIPERAMGSTWNFHVWNMVYMKRPDLAQAASAHGLNYDGWQVVDGTPQEQSEGLFQLGPCPVEAIKYGYKADFDADFVIGEVNADMVHYIQRGTEESPRFEEFSRNQRTVGKKMSVKQIGRDARQDVTSLYKFEEGTSKERESFRNKEKAPSVVSRSFNPFAREAMTGNGEAGDNHTAPISFEADCPKEVIVGKDFSYSVKAEVKQEDDVKFSHVHVHVLVEGTDYTGKSMGVIKNVSKNILLSDDDRSNDSAEINVTGEEYESLLKKGVQTIHFNCMAVVHGQNDSTHNDDIVQTWTSESLVRVNVDDMLNGRFDNDVEVKPDDDAKDVAYVSMGQQFKAIALIENISHTTLTGVSLRVEGEGIKKLEEIPLDDLQVGEKRDIEIQCRSTKVGDRLLVMTLDTVEIMDVARSMHVIVQPLEGHDLDAADDEEMGWEGDEVENVEDLVNLSSN